MADSRNIVIELVTKEGGYSQETTEQIIKSPESQFQPIQITQESSSIMRNAIVAYVATQAISDIKQIGLYHLDKNINLSENYMLKTDLSNAQNVYEKTKSFGSSVLRGSFIGGAVGAIIGAVQWGVSNTIQVLQTQDKINMEISAIKHQDRFNQARLGLVDNGRRTEN